MKKLMSILLAVLIIASMVSVAIVSAGAAGVTTKAAEAVSYFSESDFTEDAWAVTSGNGTITNGVFKLAGGGNVKSTLTAVNQYALGDMWQASAIFGFGVNPGNDTLKLSVGSISAEIYLTAAAAFRISLSVDGNVIETAEFTHESFQSSSTAFSLTYAHGVIIASFDSEMITAEVGELDFSSSAVSLYAQNSYTECTVKKFSLEQVEYISDSEPTVYYNESIFEAAKWNGQSNCITTSGTFADFGTTGAIVSSAVYNLGKYWKTSVRGAFSYNFGSDGFSIVIGNLSAKVYYTASGTYTISVIENGAVVATQDVTGGSNSGVLGITYTDGYVEVSFDGRTVEAAVAKSDFSHVVPLVRCYNTHSAGTLAKFSLETIASPIDIATSPIMGGIDKNEWSPTTYITDSGYFTIGSAGAATITSVNSYNLGNHWVSRSDLMVTGYRDQMAHQPLRVIIGDIKVETCNALYGDSDGDGKNDSITEQGYINLYIKDELVETAEVIYTYTQQLRMTLWVEYDEGAITVKHALGGNSEITAINKFDASAYGLRFDYTTLSLYVKADWYSVPSGIKFRSFNLQTPQILDKNLSGALTLADWTPSEYINPNNGQFAFYNNENNSDKRTIVSNDIYDLGSKWSAAIKFTSPTSNQYGNPAGLKIGDVKAIAYEKSSTDAAYIELQIKGNSVATYPDYDGTDGTLTLSFDGTYVTVAFSNNSTSYTAITYDATEHSLDFGAADISLNIQNNHLCQAKITALSLLVDYSDRYDSDAIEAADITYSLATGLYPAQWSNTLSDSNYGRDVATTTDDVTTYKHQKGAIILPSEPTRYAVTLSNRLYTKDYFAVTGRGSSSYGNGNWFEFIIGELKLRVYNYQPNEEDVVGGVDKTILIQVFMNDTVIATWTTAPGHDNSLTNADGGDDGWMLGSLWELIYEAGNLTVKRSGKSYGTYNLTELEGWDASYTPDGKTVTAAVRGSWSDGGSVFTDFTIEGKVNAHALQQIEQLANSDIAAAKNLYETLSSNVDDYFIYSGTVAALTPDASIIGENATVVITSPLAPIYGEEVTASVTVNEGMTFDGVYDADGNYLTNETVFTGVMLPSTKITAKAALAVFDKNFNVSLGYDIFANFYIRSLRNDLKVRFSLDGENPNRKTVELDDTYAGEDNYYRYSYNGVAPQNIGETVTAEILDGDTVIAIKQVVIEDYLNALKSDEYKGIVLASSVIGGSETKYDAMVQLVNDLLCYGAAAQGYDPLNYQGEAIDLTNAPGSDYDAYVTKLAENGIEFKSDINRKNAADLSVVWKSGNLIFDSINKIKIKLAIGEGFDFANYAFTCTIGDGEEIAVEPKLVDGFYYITTDGIYATDFDKVYTFKAYEINDPTTVIATLTYSVKSYVISKQNNQTVIGLKELVRATYMYGVSAQAFVNA